MCITSNKKYFPKYRRLAKQKKQFSIMKNKSFKWIVTSISFIVVISTLSLYFQNKLIDYNNKLTSAAISAGAMNCC